LSQGTGEAEQITEVGTQNAVIPTAFLEGQQASPRSPQGTLAQAEDLTAQVDTHFPTRRAAAASGDVRQPLDHVVKADESRVVLESPEPRAEANGSGYQRNGITIQVEVGEADATGCRADLQRGEGELRDARHALKVPREDSQASRTSQSELGHKVEKANKLVAQLLEISIAYRTTHLKALALARDAISHPSAEKESGANHTLPGNESNKSASVPLDEPSAFVDPSNPAGAIKILRSVDHDRFLDVIAKTASTIQKWQKQCKEYRERAKGKLSFRKFSKDDLALFLPICRSGSKFWAAFNGKWSPTLLPSILGARSFPTFGVSMSGTE
jgi:autophagy-related protein 11